MSSVKHVLLSLLAREPLSGYEMKQQINNRIGFFYKINNNQLYPSLAKMEAESLIELQSFEQDSYRPPRKVYKITDKGLAELKAWILDPKDTEALSDGFILKQYSAWLIDPDLLIPILEERKREREALLQEYQEKAARFRELYGPIAYDSPWFSTVAVIERGVIFERGYIEWCEKMIGWLKQKHL
ncbi:PadR family transcriptional regulator [Brevibacillus migulae]|uniref:PadR family transcriptional regulator n=1 Tax=Brevibacillus migulae TaxID=1644114 RepID=UPI00106DD4AF|nr:PadR family transcriptional regulator [Brevibacillus migulae]